MRITEGQLRRIIKEEILKEKTLADVVPERIRPTGIDLDPALRGGLLYGDKATTDFRRSVKRDWNRYADRTFFQDPQKMQVIHYLGHFSGGNSLTDYFPVGKFTPGRMPGIDVPNRNELSCYGYVPPADPMNFVSFATGPCFTFKKYRVTLVSTLDAATERLSMATPADMERMQGSGLAKRPGTTSRDEDFPIDGEGLEGVDIDEVVIDNWIVDTFYGPQEEEAYARELGLRYEIAM